MIDETTVVYFKLAAFKRHVERRSILVLTWILLHGLQWCRSLFLIRFKYKCVLEKVFSRTNSLLLECNC